MSVKKNKRFNVKVKRFSINSLALTVQKLLARLKFSKNWVKLQSQGHSVKNNGTYGKILSQRLLTRYINSGRSRNFKNGGRGPSCSTVEFLGLDFVLMPLHTYRTFL